MVKRIAVSVGALGLWLAMASPIAAQTCGDGATTGGEECDDANQLGGDGCAANCTLERELTCALAAGATSNIQSAFFAIPTDLSGQVVLAVGGLRADQPTAPVPFVIPAARAFIAPVALPGVGTACTAVGEIPGWGPGNAGGGLIDCGSTRLTGVDVSVTLDHADAPPTPTVEHSGTGPQGSVTFELGMASYSLQISSPFCVLAPNSGPPELGADRIPCTGDDPTRPVARAAYGSSHHASVRLLNPNGDEGMIEAMADGQPIDCAQLDSGATLSGATLVATTARLAAPQLGDMAITLTLVCGPGAAVATPTPRIIATCAPTATPTPTLALGGTATASATRPPSPTPPLATATATVTPPGATATSPAATATIPSTAVPTSTEAAQTPTPTMAETPAAPTATATVATVACVGDCNGDGTVTVDELVRAVNIALGSIASELCGAADANVDGTVAIDELIRAVNNLLGGCPG